MTSTSIESDAAAQTSASPAVREQAPERPVASATAKAAAPTDRAASLSIRRSTLVIGAAIAGLIATLIAVTVQWRTAEGELTNNAARAADDRHAQQMATDYAVGASKISFQDVPGWVTRLKAGTAPALANKFDATAPQFQEILASLKWTSSGVPVSAVVASESAGIFKVNVFLNVTSTSAQTPQGAQTTVTYSVTLDKNTAWQITDIGGMDGALPTR